MEILYLNRHNADLKVIDQSHSFLHLMKKRGMNLQNLVSSSFITL